MIYVYILNKLINAHDYIGYNLNIYILIYNINDYLSELYILYKQMMFFLAYDVIMLYFEHLNTL